jgi:hypothetical protein
MRIPTASYKRLEDAGEVRVKIGENPYWEGIEYLDCEGRAREVLERYALSGARLRLNYRFKPFMEVVV